MHSKIGFPVYEELEAKIRKCVGLIITLGSNLMNLVKSKFNVSKFISNYLIHLIS